MERRESSRTRSADQVQSWTDVEGAPVDEERRAWHETRSRGRSRRELPAHAVSILKAWLVSPEHFHHPYPTTHDQAQLMAATGIDKKQLKNWFTNARRRIWKPLVLHKLQAEGGKSLPDLSMSADLEQDSAARDSIGFDEEDDDPRGDCVKQVDSASFLDLLATTDVDHPRDRDHSLDDRRRSYEDEDAGDLRISTVRVSHTLRCSFCIRDCVDTQLMPCKHIFHGQCLRPWLEATVTTPCCPVCSVPISNCVLAASSARRVGAGHI